MNRCMEWIGVGSVGSPSGPHAEGVGSLRVGSRTTFRAVEAPIECRWAFDRGLRSVRSAPRRLTYAPVKRSLPNPRSAAARLLLVLLSVPLVAFAPIRSERLHPTDGPDVDVRISLDDRRVKFSVNANLAFLDEVADVPRELDDQLAEVEEEGAARTLFETLAEANRVTVDGVELDPELEYWRVLPAQPDLIALFPISGAKALVRVRVEYSYPLLAAPRQVGIQWGLFPIDPVIPVAPGGEPETIFVGAQLNAGGYDYPLEFTAEEPEFLWHGELPDEDELFLPVPTATAVRSEPSGVSTFVLVVLALTAAGAGLRFKRPAAGFGVAALLGLAAFLARTGDSIDNALPDVAGAVAIFEPLHQNIYRAFGFDEEERIYDALARSVHGDLLDGLYRQVYRGLIMEEEGGAVSRVQAVRPLEVEVEDIGLLETERPGFTLRTRWQVDGAVFHFGHAHRRTQEYEARYTVARVPGDESDADPVWRIIGNQVLSQEVVATAAGEGEEPVRPDDAGAPGVLMRGSGEL